jgi:hypothetical protein
MKIMKLGRELIKGWDLLLVEILQMLLPQPVLLLRRLAKLTSRQMVKLV